MFNDGSTADKLNVLIIVTAEAEKTLPGEFVSSPPYFKGGVPRRRPPWMAEGRATQEQLPGWGGGWV